MSGAGCHLNLKLLLNNKKNMTMRDNDCSTCLSPCCWPTSTQNRAVELWYMFSMWNMCKLEFFRVTQRKHHTFLYVIFLQMQCLIKCGYIGAFWKGRIKMILLFLGCSKKYIFCILKMSPYLELAIIKLWQISLKEVVFTEEACVHRNTFLNCDIIQLPGTRLSEFLTQKVHSK